MEIDIRELPVFYINLDADPQRRKNMERLFKKLKFKNVTRVPAIDGRDLPIRCHKGCDDCFFYRTAGISASFIKAIELAKQVSNRFIIMEDDCVVGNFTPIISIPDDANAIHLGSSEGAIRFFDDGYENREWQWPEFDLEESTPNFHRVYNMTSAHATVFMSHTYADAILECCDYEKYRAPHDVVSTKIQRNFNVYTTNIPIFWQDGLYDMTGRDLLELRD
jgi:hypothetical protein